jgi:hypothetical protein
LSRSVNWIRSLAVDQALLKTLAQFKILLKKEKGLTADLEKMMHDSAYGRQMLTAAEDSENETLVLAAITIRDKFGHFNAANKPAEEKKDDKKPEGKYMHGARS